jgi:NDP-sugar pyrophosphorylase family protein
MYPIAILAGGLATRLGSLTEKVPKSLLDVAGRPFIAHQLDLLRAAGLERAVVCVGHLGEAVERTVRNLAMPGLDVRFSYDGPALLGTAGALKKAAPLLGEAFFVMYGDSYLMCDYRAVGQAFAAAGKMGLMTVLANDDRWDRSNVEFSGGRIVAYDKKRRTPAMRHVDYGLGVLSDAALELVPAGAPHDLAALYAALLARGELAAYEVRERFYEIGSAEGLRETDELLARKGPSRTTT